MYHLKSRQMVHKIIERNRNEPRFKKLYEELDKTLKFLKDKHLWYSILAFFVTLIPWFIYGVFQYNNPLGAFIHGFKASGYWGGLQSWTFFFNIGGKCFQ